MLKDITLGQYFPGDTLAHKLDPRTKLLVTVLYIVALFTAKSYLAYGLLVLTLVVAVRISRVSVKALWTQACFVHHRLHGGAEPFLYAR